MSEYEAVRFLQQATFGPSKADVVELQETGIDAWIADQVTKEPVPYLDRMIEEWEIDRTRVDEVQDLFWERAIHGEDQLRQRMAFALSQIVVISLQDQLLSPRVREYGVYLDDLQEEALGNYCQLVRKVSLSPVMGIYLSHMGNKMRDSSTGIEPDENFAREVMQLFTIGLEMLDEQGQPLGEETYDINDISGLAKVFTGLTWANTRFDRPQITDDNRYIPMAGYPEFHEPGPKSFLGTTIDVGTSPVASVQAALDFLLTHPNVAPFISKQLIQKLVTSNPSPEYVGRVAEVFNAGSFELANGQVIGTGQRCDMAAVAAAILTDEEAQNTETGEREGKLRSPLLRLANVVRSFRGEQTVSTSGPIPYSGRLRSLDLDGRLEMNAFASPGVFNFYRPGFVEPGSEAGDMGLVTPEFQTQSTEAIIGYTKEVASFYAAPDLRSNGRNFAFTSSIEPLRELANDPMALATEADLILTGGKLPQDALSELASMIELVRIDPNAPEEGEFDRMRLAVAMIATSPEFLVQN
ncbi:DUF1800 domain-containing protein [Parvularcula sp. ZS-1/3]|uniref:DUF1800 domain-containing protein n=1 Tax=Parvularcula mediterranea TaxID=2732508 RepID=A0A7Y3RL97_9PROT|nr:DUF1800 domain-containing protein [Parvularcula mediterranea]